MILRKPSKIIVACTIALIALGTNSCTKDYFDFDKIRKDPFTWTPDLALPLVQSTMTAAEILTNVDTTNIYQVDADNFVTLIYRNTVFSQTINDLFEIPDNLAYDDSRSLDGGELGTLTGTGQVNVSYSADHPFGLVSAGGQLEYIDFYEGSQLQLRLTGDFEMEGSVTVTYPYLTQSGTPLSHTFNFDNSINPGIDIVELKNIEGYRMQLNATGPNNIPVNYILELTNNPSATTDQTNYVKVEHTYMNSRIGAARGDFGNIPLDVEPDVVDIDILENQQSGEINFEDPRLRVTMNNSFGMSMQGTINELRAIDDGAQYIDVDYTSVTPSTFIVNGAQTSGDTTSLEWYFTKDNSNIKDVMNANYKDLVYDLEAQTNPPGGTPVPNWANTNSALEVVADIELPFYGTADNFTIRDTIDFPTDDIADFKDNITEALLRVNTLNGFPVDGKLILHFTDSLYNITTSVLDNGEFLVRSGQVDGNGRVTESINTNNDIVINPNVIQGVFGARYIILDAIMSSTNNAQTPIRIFDDYELEVHLGFQVKLSASPSDLDGL